jgi:hypothetical protein
MKLLFLLLISCHYSARDHKHNEKKKEKIGFAYGKKMLIFYGDRISRIYMKMNKDIQLKIFNQVDNKIINQNLKLI